VASERGLKGYLVESDFLFGLSKADEHHAPVIKALRKHQRGLLTLTVASSAVIEARSLLYSKGLNAQMIEDALSLMDSKLAEFGVRDFTGLTLSDAVLAERLRIQFPFLSFFDSLHASIGKRMKLPMLSTEPVYSKIGMERMDLDGI